MSVHALARVRKPYVVVVGVDSTRACEAGIDWVVHRARDEAHWALHLVHVTTVQWSDTEALGRLRKVRADFERILPRMRPLAEGGVDERVVFHQACAPEASVALVRIAAEIDADLIVVGAETSFDRITRHAGCPVVVARPKGHAPRAQAVH